MKISDTVDAGTAAFYWHRTAQTRQRLAKHFPDLWQWIYTTAIIRASQECRFRRLGVLYENSLLAYMYPDLLYSPSAVSSMLDLLGRRALNSVPKVRALQIMRFLTRIPKTILSVSSCTRPDSDLRHHTMEAVMP